MNRCDKAISNKLTYDPKSSKRILRKKSSKKKSKTSSTSIRKANSYRGVPRMPPRRSLSRRGSGKRSVKSSASTSSSHRATRAVRSPDTAHRNAINRSITSISNEVMRTNKNVMSGLNKTQLTSLKCILNDTLPDLMESALNNVTAPRRTNSLRGVSKLSPRRSLSRRGSGSRRSGSRRIVRRASSGSRNLRGVSKLSPRRSLSKKRSIKRSRSPIHRRRY